MSSVLSRRSNQPGQQRSLTRRRILDATGRLLAGGRAFAELSVGEISAQADVSRPTFYSYFADKRALILSLAAEFEQDARAAAKPWLADESDDLRATLEAVLASFTAHRSTVGAVAYSLVWMTERCFTEHLSAPRLDTDVLLYALERLWHTVVPAPQEKA